jgi:RimJ/RimL family protein N-acetyltransferase
MDLHTPRLRLRDFRGTDHAAVHAFAADPEVVRYADWGPNTPQDTTDFLAEAVRDAGRQPRIRYALAVVDRTTDRVLGSIELRVTSDAHRRGEMGYAIAPAYWGRGFATEAAAALLRLGFDRVGLHKVAATCDPANVASARVLMNIGMRREGYLHHHMRIRGEWRDRLLFGATDPASSLGGQPG